MCHENPAISTGSIGTVTAMMRVIPLPGRVAKPAVSPGANLCTTDIPDPQKYVAYAVVALRRVNFKGCRRDLQMISTSRERHEGGG